DAGRVRARRDVARIPPAGRGADRFGRRGGGDRGAVDAAVACARCGLAARFRQPLKQSVQSTHLGPKSGKNSPLGVGVRRYHLIQWRNSPAAVRARRVVMSLPSQSVALLQAARDLVKSLPADAVLLLTETAIDWDEVTRMLTGCKLLVAAENPALTKSLRENPDWTVIDLDPEPLPTQERMNSALLKAVTDETLQPGAHVVALYN